MKNKKCNIELPYDINSVLFNYYLLMKSMLENCHSAMDFETEKKLRNDMKIIEEYLND